MPTKRPNKLTLRTYQVGFGDCFLLTFHYPSTNSQPNDRHVLIDFGSTHSKSGMKSDFLKRIAEDIKAVTGGKLHAVVATHRHRDHISGFATDTTNSGGSIIASLKPDLVVQPWTEDPNAATSGTVPTTNLTDSHAFVRSLAEMSTFAKGLTADLGRLKGFFGPRRLKELSFLGENNIKNQSAVKNLMEMGKKSRAAYVHFNSNSGLAGVLPGVKVTVLGPPTLEQSNEIRNQRAKDEAEFWHLQAASKSRFVAGGRRLFPRAASLTRKPAYTRWLIERLDATSAEQLFQIVRILDSAMNNTSVILLFEIGQTKLLFPGDAQIENWSFALSKADVRKRLESVAVYKVGHHGSLNATPQSLWKLFKRRSENVSAASRLKTFMSTCPGVHGSTQRNTEVPRKTLKQAMAKESHLVSTDDISGGTLCHSETIPL